MHGYYCAGLLSREGDVGVWVLLCGVWVLLCRPKLHVSSLMAIFRLTD